MARYYFLASCLPPMPALLGEKLLVPFSEIGELILRNIEPGDKPLVYCCLLLTDIVNVEFYLQGQNVYLPGGSLTREEIETRRNLPSFIKSILEDKEQGNRRGYQHDNLWEGYYGYAYSLAEALNCRFLIDYLSWEIGLKNSLTGMRAASLGKEIEEHQIMLQRAMHDFSPIISQLKLQNNPLRAEQFLDEERLRRIYHCEGPDPFSLDAILGTLERARIYSRWEKLNTEYEVHEII
jgi:hypothetical protein